MRRRRFGKQAPGYKTIKVPVKLEQETDGLPAGTWVSKEQVVPNRALRRILASKARKSRGIK